MAFVVSQNLDFDVAWPIYISLEEKSAVAESRLSLVPCRLDGRFKAVRVLDDAHAFPAATGGRLD